MVTQDAFSACIVGTLFTRTFMASVFCHMDRLSTYGFCFEVTFCALFPSLMFCILLNTWCYFTTAAQSAAVASMSGSLCKLVIISIWPLRICWKCQHAIIFRQPGQMSHHGGQSRSLSEKNITLSFSEDPWGCHLSSFKIARPHLVAPIDIYPILPSSASTRLNFNSN